MAVLCMKRLDLLMVYFAITINIMFCPAETTSLPNATLEATPKLSPEVEAQIASLEADLVKQTEKYTTAKTSLKNVLG